MKTIKDEAYFRIVNPILENKDFNGIAEIKHHDSNRLNHSLKVSYYSYKVAKLCRLNVVATARAGLLHDFYYESILDQNSAKEKMKLYLSHQEEAVNNSRKYFNLSDREENIIATHMFPVTKKIPRYKESWVVTSVDKGVAIAEFIKKFNYKFGVYVLFLFNILKVSI